MVLASSYLPPISWFAQLCLGEPVFLEQYEHFHKQTIRNRCTIDSPNGPLHLTVPIDKSNFSAGAKCLMRDVRISYRSDWQHQHWNAIQSSYFNSPFFEYLQDDFRPLFHRQWTYLMDMNEAFIDLCCRLIDIHPQIKRTTDFIGSSLSDSSLVQSPYYQVFAHKHGFLPNLSIIDLIFNLAGESLIYFTDLQSPTVNLLGNP